MKRHCGPYPIPNLKLHLLILLTQFGNPVEIDTLYYNNQDRKLRLTNVGHFIAVYLPEMQPSEQANCDGNTLETLRPGNLFTEFSPSTHDDL